METSTIISSLEAFQKAFPGTRIIVLEDELRYRFRIMGAAKTAEKLAQEIILKEGLRITAALEIWEIGGFVREIALVVKPVPEESIIAR